LAFSNIELIGGYARKKTGSRGKKGSWASNNMGYGDDDKKQEIVGWISTLFIRTGN